MKNTKPTVLLICFAICAFVALIVKAQDVPQHTYTWERATNISDPFAEEIPLTNRQWLPPQAYGHRERAFSLLKYKFHVDEITVSNLNETTVFNGGTNITTVKTVSLSTKDRKSVV